MHEFDVFLILLNSLYFMFEIIFTYIYMNLCDVFINFCFIYARLLYIMELLYILPPSTNKCTSRFLRSQTFFNFD